MSNHSGNDDGKTDSKKPAPGKPTIGDERVVLHSNRGDLVIGLYDEVAPKHAAQIRKLVKLGVYDGTSVFRLERNFVAQITNAQNRQKALSPEQHRAITPIPAEFSKLPHVLGAVSMARDDDDVNSAETSFSLVLGRAKELDGKYTIIGEVEFGRPLLAMLNREPADAKTHRPLYQVVIEKAEVKTAAEIATLTAGKQLRDAVPPPPPPPKGPKPVSR